MNTLIQDAVDQLTDQMAAPEDQNPEAATEVEAVTENTEELDLSNDSGEVIETDDSPAIEAPSSWSKDDVEHFSTLPLATQERLAKQARDRDLNIRQNQDQNAEERKSLKADRESVNQQKADFLENLTVYGPQKPSIDMLDQESEAYDPDAYHTANNKYEKSQEKADKVRKELDADDVNAQNEWAANESTTYKKVLPEFVDPKTGQKYRNELAEYGAKAMGITVEEIAKIFPTTPASQMLMMDKARKYDAAIAKQKAGKTTPKPKTLSGGNSNPSKPVKKNLNDAAANYKKNPTKENASKLFGIN